MADLDRYTELFLEEAAEHTQDLDRCLLRLEREGARKDLIEDIFRVAHTLKSSAAFIGLDRLSELAHHMEDLFQGIREGKLDVNTALINLLFQALDNIKHACSIVARGEKPADTFEDLIEALKEMRASASPASAFPASGPATPPAPPMAPASGPLSSSAAAPPVTSPAAPRVPESAPTASVPASPVDVAARGSASASGKSSSYAETADEPEWNTTELILSPDEERELERVAGENAVFLARVTVDPDAPMKNMRFLLMFQHLNRAGTIFKALPDEQALESGVSVGTLTFLFFGNIKREELARLCQVDMITDVRLSDYKATSLRKSQGLAGGDESRVQTRNIKVSSEKIDYLLNNVGELVITNSGLQKIYEDLHNFLGENQILAELKTKIDQAGRIARDLQSGIMKTRMIPVGLVFHRFTRPIRDIALELGKEVDLVVTGEDTELDKNIIDALSEPLMHLIRNSLDHGIEPPEIRKAAGKPAAGKLTLNSYQSGNNVYVEIRDDGRGLDKKAIFNRGRASGVIADDQLLSDDEIYNLIFQPGFSTAEKVTDISGRGVGMSAVRKAVHEFNGSIQIQNEPGQGCAFLLSFPMTLAIISSILVRVLDEIYAFPLSDVVETIKIARDEITTLERRDIFNLRGEILPVYSLAELMGMTAEGEAAEFPVLIALVGNRKVGFIVDGMIGKQEIVIKTLEQNFRQVRGLVGATLMGDGRIVMVLDVQGLMEIAYTTVSLDPSLRALDALTGMEQGPVHALRAYNAKVIELQSRHMIEQRREVVVAGRQAVAEERPVSTVAYESRRGSVEITPPVETVPFDFDPPEPDPGPRHDEIDDERVAAALGDLRREKDERMRRARAMDLETDSTGEPEFEETFDITETDYGNLNAIINTGMMNAGMVLSQLLGSDVDVSVPEVQIVDKQGILRFVPEGKLINLLLDTEKGELKMYLFLVFDQPTAYSASGDLMGLPREHWNPTYINDEDRNSVLAELTNIVGSSVFNVLANKTGHVIKSAVPEFVEGLVDNLVSKMDEAAEGQSDYKVIYVSVDFFREGTDLLSRLFLLIPRSSFYEVIRKLR